MLRTNPIAHTICFSNALTACFLGLVTVAGACKSGANPIGPENGVRVLSATPTAQTYFTAEPIRIQFDKPVASEDRVGTVLSVVPAKIEPAIEFEARFVDRQTLQLKPSKPLAASTRYRVSLSGELAELTGGYDFEFVSVPLEIEGVWGIALDNLPLTPTLPLHFNQPTSAEAVAKHCKFVDANPIAPTEISVLASVASSQASEASAGPNAGSIASASDGPIVPRTSSIINVSPKRALAIETNYQLSCSGLAGIGGSEPMSGSFALKLKTHPLLSVTSVKPNGSGQIFADRTRFQFEFSNPMELASLREGIRLIPTGGAAKASGSKPIEMKEGWLSYSDSTYIASVELPPRSEFKLVVSKKIVDAYGQALGTDHETTIKVGSARPTLSMETGIYAVESSLPSYPIWSKNIGEMSVSCAQVTEKSIVGLLTSSMDYDPWYDAADREIDWNKHKLARKQKVYRPTAEADKWALSRVDLGKTCGSGKSGGLFLAEVYTPDLKREPDRAWAYRPRRRVLANVTDLGVLLKAGPSSGLVWVTALSTGKPISNAEVTVFNTKGKKVFSGRSNLSGLVKLPGTTSLLERGEADARESSYRSQRMITMVKKGGDLAVVDGNWANGIQTWNFGVNEDRTAGTTKIRGFIQSDRGIYRPGESVKFKGLLREFRGARAPTVPRGKKVAVTITDSRGQAVHTGNLTLSRFGGFDFSYDLSAEGAVGDYVVTAELGKQKFRERFVVEEFRKVTFEIDSGTYKRHQRLGEKLAFSTKTDYLFGAPVQNGKVRWDVSKRAQHVSFKQFPGYGFADYAAKGYFGWWAYDGDRYSNFVGSGDGKTDDEGRFGFSVNDDGSSSDGAQTYVAQVTVTDEADHAVTKRVAVTAHPTDYYLGLHAQEWVQAVGMPFAINAVAMSPEGKQLATTAKLSLIHETRSCKWTKRGYRSYPECENVHKLVSSKQIKIPETGSVVERVLPSKPGDYIIRIESKDSRGKKIAASTYVWVLGKGEAFWSGDESARMTLIASKAEYKPGETARLVPRTGLIKPTALVTLERNGVIESFVKEMDSPYEGISVPMRGALAPNVFASVAMVSGRHGKGDRHRPQFKMGVVDLRVSAKAKELAVTVTTERATYQPGERIRGVVKVRSGGRPMIAEVAVSAADEGVLQLIGYKTPNPFASFYKSWGLGVDNGTNWNRIARLNAPAGADPDAGGDSGEGKNAVRSKFVNSAFWQPALVTNERGEARFEFDAPDNLSAFRIMAVAANISDKFGSSDSRVTIAKPLLAKPVLPRFLTEKDTSEVGVMVHNYTETAGQVTVSASATGAEITPAKKRVQIAAGGSARVAFYATAKPTSVAAFQFSVRKGKDRDALRVEVPIERAVVRNDTLVARGTLGKAGKRQTAIAINWPAAADTEASELTISVDRIGLSELEPSLRSLIEYPYGCLEQTLSRFVPLTKVADLAGSLDLDHLRGPKLKSFVAAGAAKVVRHQASDGHYSLWPGAQTRPHLTAYATWGLHQAKNAGVKIDEGAYNRGIAALKRHVGKTLTGETNYGTAAMIAYLLAEADATDAGLIGRLYEKRQSMPNYGKAFLLMAMHHGKTSAAVLTAFVSEIESLVSASGLVVEKSRYSEVMSSDVRTSALVLSALLLTNPKSESIEPLVAGLKKAQIGGGRWRTTQENMYGLVALADYARTQAGGSSDVYIRMGNKPLARKLLRGGKVFSMSLPKSGSLEKELIIESRGKLVYTVRRRDALPLDAAAKTSNGFEITRSFHDPATGVEITRPRVGQVLVAKVKVKTDVARRYVAVVDPLPAGIEPLNTKLATVRRDRPSQADRRTWKNHWDHTELRDNEARAFRDYLPSGETTLSYRVRVALPGKYTRLPARVEQMYAPEVNARSVATALEVTR